MNKFLIFLFVFFAFSVAASAQKNGDYKITNIKITPFDRSTGEFETEITDNDTEPRSFFNELDKGLFLIVEVSGKAGDYQNKKGLQITVTEGKKIKLKKIYFSGILNEQGKFYFPVWLEPAMCDEIKISATVTGQKTVSKMIKSIPFMCGE